MKRLLTALVALVALAVPLAAGAAGKTHTPSGDQECAECHEDQEKVWLEGKHGLMGVKCVVCHGAPEVNFTVQPGLDRCRGCHADQVADVQRKLPPKEQFCVKCHDHHTVAVTEPGKSGFHGEGGAR